MRSEGQRSRSLGTKPSKLAVAHIFANFVRSLKLLREYPCFPKPDEFGLTGPNHARVTSLFRIFDNRSHSDTVAHIIRTVLADTTTSELDGTTRVTEMVYRPADGHPSQKYPSPM